MCDDFESHEHVDSNPSKESEGSSRLRDDEEIDDSVKDPSNCEDSEHKGGSGNSRSSEDVIESKEEKWKDIFYIILVSSSNPLDIITDPSSSLKRD